MYEGLHQAQVSLTVKVSALHTILALLYGYSDHGFMKPNFRPLQRGGGGEDEEEVAEVEKVEGVRG